MVTARDPTVLNESGSASPSWSSHAHTGSGSGQSKGQSSRPCYWVNIWTRLNAMRNCLQLCDIDLEAEDGATFRAHSAVLAASSDVFHGHLMLKKSAVLRDTGNNKILVQGVSGRALKVTLDFVYGIAPTDPEEFSLLREGGQVMAISGALAFCKRNSLVRQQKPLCTAVSSESATDSAQLQSTGAKPRQPSSDLDLMQVRNGSTGSHDPSELPQKGTYAPAHNDFVLDLSFTDLESVGKCPVLKEFANEEADGAATDILPANPCSFIDDESQQDLASAGQPQPTRKNSCAIDSSTELRTGLDSSQSSHGVAPSSSSVDMASDEGKPDDLDIGELTCPFAKSAAFTDGHSGDGQASSGEPNGNRTATNGDPVLQCPFLKSLSDIPPDVMMKAEKNEASQNKAMCTSGKIMESLNLLSADSSSQVEEMSKLSGFQRDPTSNRDMLTESQWSDIAVSQMDCNQYGVGAFQSTKFDESCYAKDPCLYDVTQRDDLPEKQISQPSSGQVVPTTANQNPLSSLPNLQSQEVSDIGLPNGAISQKQIFSVAGSRLDGTFQVSNPVPKQDYISTTSSNADHLIMTASSQQEMFPSQYKVECRKTGETFSGSASSLGNGFIPELCVDKEMAFYSSSVPSEVSRGSAASLVDQIYGSVAGEGGPSGALSSSSVQIAGSGLSQGGVTAEAKPVQSVVLSANPLCQGVLRSPDTSCQRAVVSPESHSSSAMTSPIGSLLWDVTDYASLDNATIKARLKLNRGQEYVCLDDGCCYSNKCLDYMQSHMYRKHGLGKPDVHCTLCEKAFFSVGQLKGHTKRAHKPETKQSSVESVQCEDCNETFTNVQKLQTHRLKSHCKGRLFTCEECDFRSPRKKDVQAHMVSQHKKIPPGVQVFECIHCDYKCTDKNRAEEHQAMHTGQPKFVCKICGKSYTTRRGMRTHMQYHSTERPHRCDTCNAAFKVRSKLRDHIRLVHTHVGVKPYECGYCGHKTALRGNCNQHCRKHHPELPVFVIDHQQGERRNKRSYDYAGLKGDGIEECKDVRKHLRAVSP